VTPLPVLVGLYEEQDKPSSALEYVALHSSTETAVVRGAR
jgi:hypothetical protein